MALSTTNGLAGSLEAKEELSMRGSCAPGESRLARSSETDPRPAGGMPAREETADVAGGTPTAAIEGEATSGSR